MLFSKEVLKDIDRASEKEWLVTNGLGGFASGTPIGANIRRYHGILFAALKPPLERILLVSKYEETLEIDGESFELGVNETAGGLYPQGNKYLSHFELRPHPTFLYHIKDIVVEKTIFMVYGENTTVVKYRLLGKENSRVKIRVRPWLNCRDYHWMTKKKDWPFKYELLENGAIFKAYEEAPEVRILGEGLRFQPGPGYWFEGVYYRGEAVRGEERWEDHYVPGEFISAFSGEGTAFLLATAEDRLEFKGKLLEIQEEKRLAKLIELAGFRDQSLSRLVVAADQFIVKRESTNSKTVIAGYPWFTDWGRDTMIALTGLTLVSNRFTDAKEILRTFALSCQKGLIPNRFPDWNEEPDYNTVDASLWFFIAAYKYWLYTGDGEFVKEELFPVLEKIIDWHIKGTEFDIFLDDDGLISAGNEKTQLTWMDAKVDEWVVTPRHGKAVEINALWYNALKIMEEFSSKFQGGESKKYLELANKSRSSFVEKFWNSQEACLFDVIMHGEAGEIKDPSIRPNQIIAISLPFSLLDNEKETQIVNKVWSELYTPFGLRSLSPGNPSFHGRYEGDRWQRDGAYHQGTVWSWLMGPFITAFCKVYEGQPDTRELAEKLLRPLLNQLSDHGIGSISEIFDGGDPYTPRGCIAQAWGVAEVLRCYYEDVFQGKR